MKPRTKTKTRPFHDPSYLKSLKAEMQVSGYHFEGTQTNRDKSITYIFGLSTKFGANGRTHNMKSK